MSEHRFPYRWRLADGYPAKGIEHHGCKVFGTFICGGGSTMGYKLAGYDHLGGVEIDPAIAKTYIENHHPTYMFVEDLRKFNQRDDLPPELYDLDILDGSPPCSTFSMAGKREKAWGKEKRFKEGQQLQTLDDLVFVYCNTIAKLKPRVCLLENVAGLVHGNAKSYCKRIIDRLHECGYKRVQVFVLNAAKMGVPQTRTRAFFIGLRDDLPDVGKLHISTDEEIVPFGAIRDMGDNEQTITSDRLSLWKLRQPSDMCYGDIILRTFGEHRRWTETLAHDGLVHPTLTSTPTQYLYSAPRHINTNERLLIASFPLDYNFAGKAQIPFLTGMSVAPVQMAHIASAIWEQWLKPLGRGECAAQSCKSC